MGQVLKSSNLYALADALQMSLRYENGQVRNLKQPGRELRFQNGGPAIKVKPEIVSSKVTDNGTIAVLVEVIGDLHLLAVHTAKDQHLRVAVLDWSKVKSAVGIAAGLFEGMPLRSLSEVSGQLRPGLVVMYGRSVHAKNWEVEVPRAA